jgi:hypothetical protein
MGRRAGECLHAERDGLVELALTSALVAERSSGEGIDLCLSRQLDRTPTDLTR